MKQPDLGKKILELRLAKGLTQGELAEKCNLSLRTIQRIELSEVTPRSYTIKLIFSCLEYDFHNAFEELPDKTYNNVSGNKVWLGQFYRYVLELFNLKTDTMKKVSFISIAVIAVIIGLFMVNHESNAQSVKGWIKAGSKPNSYNVGIDKSTFKTGGSSAFIESTEQKIEGFGTLMQICNAQEYLGKRIKMTAYIKSENIKSEDISNWAGMWLRVDSKSTPRNMLSFDNMQDRPIKGNTDWTKYEIILDVPEASGTLNYGVLLSGTGKVWFDDISFETVDKMDIKTTNQNLIPDKPSNVDFEK
jgi:transcriptional regulator with XRE-family HTH domain